MKILLAFATAALFAGPAHAEFDACNVVSDYDLAIGDALTFTRDTGTPAVVELRDGLLSVDGTAQRLSPADTTRIATIEREIRTMVPPVKAIAIDAVGVAVEAVEHVATSFAGTGNTASVERLRVLGDDLGRRIQASTSTAEWRDGAFDAAVAQFSAELAPLVAADIASVAMAAALSGDTDKLAEIEARADTLGKEVETRIDGRSDDIEARAERLCPRVQALDGIESSLEFRLPDGSALDLIELEPR